ncbi:unnamed protein product [Closterium sp. NIES-54]
MRSSEEINQLRSRHAPQSEVVRLNKGKPVRGRAINAVGQSNRVSQLGKALTRLVVAATRLAAAGTVKYHAAAPHPAADRPVGGCQTRASPPPPAAGESPAAARGAPPAAALPPPPLATSPPPPPPPPPTP